MVIPINHLNVPSIYTKKTCHFVSINVQLSCRINHSIGLTIPIRPHHQSASSVVNTLVHEVLLPVR